MMQCSNCGETKPEEAFRTKQRMRQCRACENEKHMARLRRKPDSHMRAIEAYRRYHERSPSPPRKRDHRAEYQKHRQKKLLRAETKRLIARGDIPSETSCSACGGPNPEVHHLSYDRPDNIVWLCRKCHTNEHRVEFDDLLEARAAIRADKGGDD